MVYTINKNVDANYLLYYPCGPKLEDDQSRIQLGLWSFKRLIEAIFVELHGLATLFQIDFEYMDENTLLIRPTPNFSLAFPI